MSSPLRKKIKLQKSSSPIVFLGGMNAMPMMYAIELRSMGYNVLYFVDAPASNLLSRPEHHYPEITYPYPEWIVEFPLPSQMLLPLFPKLFSRIILKKVREKSGNNPQVIFFNGFFASLISHFDGGSSNIFLSHGSDLDSWADEEGSAKLARAYRRKSIFKFLPGNQASKLVCGIVARHFYAASRSDATVYFPPGFNEAGDRVIDKLKLLGVPIFYRYDVSFRPLHGRSRDFKVSSGELSILSAVRFEFDNLVDKNPGYNKGNDKIIIGLGLLYKKYKNLRIHFVEKGSDIAAAKLLCREWGLEDIVTWHKEMSLHDLIELYLRSDICFDQCGSHWIGAVGCYSLWLGKPLIADATAPVRAGIWPQKNPILQANTAEEILERLVQLLDEGNREMISHESKIFAALYLSPDRLLNDIFNFGEED